MPLAFQSFLCITFTHFLGWMKTATQTCKQRSSEHGMKKVQDRQILQRFLLLESVAGRALAHTPCKDAHRLVNGSHCEYATFHDPGHFADGIEDLEIILGDLMGHVTIEDIQRGRWLGQDQGQTGRCQGGS